MPLSYLVLPLIDRHLPLVTLLILGSLLVPVRALLLGQGLEVLRNDLGNLTKLGVGVCRLDIVAGSVRVQEEAALVTLGGVGVLGLLLLFLLLGGIRVRVGIGLEVRGWLVRFHLALVTLLVLGGELVPAFLLGFGDRLELGGEDLGLCYGVGEVGVSEGACEMILGVHVNRIAAIRSTAAP